MKSIAKITIISICLIYSFALGNEPGGAEYLDFKSQQGTALRARILSADTDTGKVTLRSVDGRDLNLDINLLSPADQNYIQKWNPNERKDALFSGLGKEEIWSAFGMGEVTMELSEGKYFLPAMLNEKRRLFFVDTATFLSIVDRTVAEETEAEFTGTTYANFNLADGTMEPVKSAQFKQFSLGSVSSPNWQMGTCDLAKVGRPYQGVIGSDFLELKRGIVDWKNLKVYLSLEKDRVFKAPEVAPEARVFTNRAGNSVTGSFVDIVDDTVTLNVKGKDISLKVGDLSGPDREYVDLWVSSPTRSLENVTVTEILKAKGYQPVPYSFGNSVIPAFELKIRTRKLRFLINPLFDFSFFDKKLANELDFPVEKSNDRLGLASGEVIQLETSTIRGLEAGDTTLPAILFRVIGMEEAGANGAVPISTCTAFRFPELKERQTKKAEIDGVLGRDVLVKLGAMIDYDSKTMFFPPGENQ